MISASDFKKQISKRLASLLKTIGLKGAGFNYILYSDNFIFTIGIQASQYGGQCCAEFGIHPKEIDRIGEYQIDFKKLKYHSCEFSTRLSRNNGEDQWWKYSDKEQANIEIAEEIYSLIKKNILPIINLFQSEPYILDKIEIEDLDNIYKNVSKKLSGMTLMTTDVRFAWALTQIYAKRDLAKAKVFSKYGLSKLDSSSLFFGKEDFENILNC